MYPAVLLISAAVILLVSLASIVQVSLPYNNTGRARLQPSLMGKGLKYHPCSGNPFSSKKGDQPLFQLHMHSCNVVF
jgi:hypothetical protein